MINLNPTLTAAGLALFSGQSPGFNVAITHVAFGSSKYDPIGYETALNAELARFPIDGSALISPSSIQVGVLMTNAAPGGSTANGQWIGEIGFYAGNTLFAVLSHAAAYLFFKSPDIDIPVTYVLDFSVLPPGSITVNNDALSSSIALASSYAQAAAKTSLDTLKAIQSRFYGNYSFDPQTRPDGSPREAGDEYFNTTDNQRKTYTGNAWSAPTYSPDAVAITGGTISHVIQNGLYNCDPSKFAWWCSALAKARAGYQPARLLMPGDSTTSGVGSNPSSPSIDSRRRAYPARLAEVLTAQYGLQADASSIWCDGFEGMNIGKFDPRIKLGAGWSISNTFVAGGRAFLSNAKFNR